MPSKLLLAGESVAAGVNADGLEDLGILAQTLPLEPGFGELTPVFITRPVIEQPAPARVLPGRRADEHALHRQIRRPFGQFLSGEGHASQFNRPDWEPQCTACVLRGTLRGGVMQA